MGFPNVNFGYGRIADSDGNGGKLVVTVDAAGGGGRFVYNLGDTMHNNMDYQTIPEPAKLDGDVDGDGFVGGGDLNTIIGNWGLSGATRTQGDLTGEGDVGGADYNEVLGNWGAGTPPPETIPEPATFALLLLAGLALATNKPLRSSTKTAF